MKYCGRLTGLLFLLALMLPVTDAAYAVMSIDLGNQYLKIGIVKPGVPMEIVLNKEFRRKTVNMVGLRNGERFFSDAAANLNVKFPMSTYGYLTELLGKKFDDPAVAQFQKRFPYHKIFPDEKRNTVVFETDLGPLNIETIVGMILWNAKEVTKVYAGQKVDDAIFTVPSYFGNAEKSAISAAAEIAGIKLLKIISEGSAIGLNYGVFRMNEINETKQNMLIYDIGASKTTAVIIEYEKIKNETSKTSYPRCKTLGFGYDKNLGGFELTMRLRDYLVESFKANYKSSKDISENPRAMAKMMKEAERVKQVLSANADHKAQIENVFEDIDFKQNVKREDFYKLFNDLDDKWTKPIDGALEMAGLTMDNINKFVLFGGGTRVPKILDILQKYLGEKDIGRFLNTDEAASLGAVYYGAYLIKGFQVKKFEIEERDDIIEMLSKENPVEEMDDESIKKAIALLKDFEIKEREKAEREAAHNNLEALVYSSKDNLENVEFSQYATENEIENIKLTADKIGLWLEDEVSLLTTTTEFKEKTKELKDAIKPIEFRKKQHLERPKKIKGITKVLNETIKFIEKSSNMTDLISEEEMKVLQEAYDKTLLWWEEKKLEIENLALNSDPSVTTSEISEQTQNLKREWKYLENKLRLNLIKMMKEKAEKEAAEKKAAEEALKASNTTEKVESVESSGDVKVDVNNSNSEKTIDETVKDQQENKEENINENEESKNHDASEL
ncbi:Hypoxia up-regulated protein 1 [Strongyloides ratti]|uniref:Hypoxia up-regulated protein 1 n=1 Tax=Strongyloides ratti TaxID=34506 RepID=A0A090LE59_STRRB|nr:Hypoxia up-regulated protein 1 [Strongyloides ratti]CEF68071.1 Hypoxia up-regulated protein 1 [Strongyloides ratti]